MKVIEGVDNPRLEPTRRVIAEGAFDGVHRGHQVLLEAAAQALDEYEAELAVLTFEPAPVQVFSPHNSHNIRLTLRDERQRELQEWGVETLVVTAFDEALRETSAHDFARQYLCDQLGAVAIVVSENHTWGRRAEADVHLMKQLGRQLGFEVRVVPLATHNGQPISSSQIRHLLWAGEVGQAAQLLGRPYGLSGVVQSGAGRGQRLGFPTANLAVPDAKLVPARGVYTALAQVGALPSGQAGEERMDQPAVVSVGASPTFAEHEDKRLVEVHLLDFEDDLRGATVTVHFVDRLRGQRAFHTEAALKTQIAADIRELRLRLAVSETPASARPSP